MYKSIFSFGLIVVLFAGCKKEDSTLPDPLGTNTMSLNYTVSDGWAYTIYKGLEPSNMGYPNFPYVWLKCGIYDASLNFVFWIKYYPDATYTNWGPNIVGQGGEIVNIGSVKGLGNINTKPSIGWSATTAVESGHGYVLRVRNSGQYGDSSLPYFYYRMYVTEYLKSIYGEVIGAKVKYQGPF